MNISLLCKWWWLLENGNMIWQDIVKLKYVKQFPICSIPHGMRDSPHVEGLDEGKMYLPQRRGF
jgi:hypothetical protein